MKKLALGFAVAAIVATPALAATLAGTAEYTTIKEARIVVALSGGITSVFLCNTGGTDPSGAYEFKSTALPSAVTGTVLKGSCVMLTSVTSLVLKPNAGAGWNAKATFYIP